MELSAGIKKKEIDLYVLIWKRLLDLLPSRKKKQYVDDVYIILAIVMNYTCICVSGRMILIGRDRWKRRNHDWIFYKVLGGYSIIQSKDTEELDSVWSISPGTGAIAVRTLSLGDCILLGSYVQ